MASYAILPGLPPYGKPAVPFPSDPRGSFREGFVVRFDDENGSWIGNFRRGWRACDRVVRHPDGRSLIVVAGGAGYVVDPSSPCPTTAFEHCIDSVDIVTGEIVVLSDGSRCYMLAASGTWASDPFTWDSFRDLKVIGSTFRGEGLSIASDVWQSFSVDLDTHETTGALHPYQIP